MAESCPEPAPEQSAEPAEEVDTEPEAEPEAEPDHTTQQSRAPLGRVAGIDVSNHQKEIDWDAVAGDGTKVAYLKATEHTGFTDGYYAENRREANAAGIRIGAYHFARPGHEGGSIEADARAEAKHFLSVAKPASGDLVPVLDLEATGNLSKSELGRWTDAFLDAVEQRVGTAPMIYTSPGFWDSNVSDTRGIAASHPLWVAHWGVSSPDVPGNWDAWNGWQKTSSGSVDGISGRVDENTFRVTDDIVL